MPARHIYAFDRSPRMRNHREHRSKRGRHPKIHQFGKVENYRAKKREIFEEYLEEQVAQIKNLT